MYVVTPKKIKIVIKNSQINTQLWAPPPKGFLIGQSFLENRLWRYEFPIVKWFNFQYCCVWMHMIKF